MRPTAPPPTRSWCAPAVTVALLASCAGPLLAQGRNIRFDHLSLEEGLSQSNVTSIYQDRHGFLWVGTEEGLNRYDGHGFRVFSHNADDPTSLSHNFVWVVMEDRNATLWIATYGGGLNRYEPATETFVHHRHRPDDPKSLSHDRVRTIFEDRDGGLWVGTDGGGLNLFDAVSGNFVRIRHDPEDANSLSHDSIRSMAEGSHGTLWIGTYGGGLNAYARRGNRFTHYRHDPNDASSLSSDFVRVVYVDNSGVLWVGTYDHGLNRFDPVTGTFERFRHRADDPNSLSSDRVRDIFQDRSGTLWVATEGGLNEWRPKTGGFTHYHHDPADPRALNDDRLTKLFQDRGGVLWIGSSGSGLNKWNPITGSFDYYKQDPNRPGGLSGKSVHTFAEDVDGSIWIGSHDGGLNRLDRTTDTFTNYRHDPADPSSLSDERVMSLLVDSRVTLWVGTFRGGLNRFDRETGSFRHYRNDPDDPKSLPSDGVITLYEDDRGDLWIGTFGGGLSRFDRGRETFLRFQHDPDDAASISSNRVTAIHEEHGGFLWVGTHDAGLNRFDRGSATFFAYRADPDDETSLSSDQIWCLLEDRDGVLWIGTAGGGLNRLAPQNRRRGIGVFDHFTQREGLPNDFIYGILPDDEGNLWLSTNSGISKFNPQTERFKNYSMINGLQSDEFNFGAYLRASTGELFFGGINGINVFNPKLVRDNSHVPPVVLTSYLKNNQQVALDRSIAELGAVEIGYRDHLVSFDFAALDFTAPDKNQYAYKLEGFDEAWIELGALHRATFTNLPAGNYTLRVRASNNDGLWNEEGLALGVRVIAPPWKRWWAYTLYGLAVLGVILAYTRAQRRKLEREEEYSRRLEVQVQLRTSELELKTAELAASNEDLQRANEKLQNASVTDALTGLKNRHFLLTEVQSEIREASLYYRGLEVSSSPRFQAPRRRRHVTQDFLFLMIDLDGFKALNDTYGHAAGDAALLEVSGLLHQACRDTDTIIRWGGDEFMVVARRVDRLAAEVVSERIRQSVEAHRFEVGNGEVARMTASIGFAFFPFVPQAPELLTGEQTIQIADRALYVSKTSGRNAWTGIYGNDNTPRHCLLELLDTRLELAVAQNKVTVRTSIDAPDAVVWQRA